VPFIQVEPPPVKRTAALRFDPLLSRVRHKNASGASQLRLPLVASGGVFETFASPDGTRPYDPVIYNPLRIKKAGRWSGARLRSTHRRIGGYRLW